MTLINLKRSRVRRYLEGKSLDARVAKMRVTVALKLKMFINLIFFRITCCVRFESRFSQIPKYPTWEQELIKISGLSPQLFGRRKPQENDTHSFFDLWCVRWCRQQDYLKDIKHWQKRCHVDSIDNSNSNQVSINFSISYSHTVNLTMLIVNTILTWFWHNVGSVQSETLRQ